MIVGGGFAGLFAARALRRAPSTSRWSTAPSTTCSSRCSTSGDRHPVRGTDRGPAARLLKRHRNVECLLAEVVDVDARTRTVVAARPGGTRVELPYDDLIVAAGVRQSYFGHDEFARWAPGMKTIADALAIRRKIFGAFELAETAADATSGGAG